jgi:inward rectifier potassium channel
MRRLHMFERKGEESVLRVGMEKSWLTDLYHRTLVIGWSAFIGWFVWVYIIVNVLFGLLYMLDPHGVTATQPGHFFDFFFFSVQTFSTVGYGRLTPVTPFANLIVTCECLTGTLLNALFTGLAFARFSRPNARVLFSKVAVVSHQEGDHLTLSVRLANQRRSSLLAADVEATLIHLVSAADGRLVRRLDSLKLVRERTPIFALTFLAEHIIDETSPLSGVTRESLEARNAEIIITVNGLDNVTSQTVHASAAYGAENIIWNQRFVDIVGYADDGYRVVDYRRFHTTESDNHRRH